MQKPWWWRCVLDGLVHITKKESANDCHIRRAAHAGLPPFGTHTSWSWHALAVGGSQTTLHHEDQIRLSVPNSAYNSSIVFQLKYFEQGTCNLPPLLKRREKHTLVRKQTCNPVPAAHPTDTTRHLPAAHENTC